MKDSMLSEICALETVQNASKLAQAIAAARAQHNEATRATESLTAQFGDILELRATHARFAVCFLRELHLMAACRAAGIGYETGRTYLKKLFDVTGSKSQVELVVILCRLVHL